MGIGRATWACVSELEEELYPKPPFFTAVCNFYIATIKKVLKKFPFKDSILKDLGIINHEQACCNTLNTIEKLAKQFPQFDLHTSNSLDRRLREEFTDFKLSPGDHPSLEKPDYKSAVGWKPRASAFWIEVRKIKTLDGRLRFPSLYKLMTGLLYIPSSNADAECGFSILRKIHTDQRPSLKQQKLSC